MISRSTAFVSSTTNVGWYPGRRTAVWWSGISDWRTESEQGDIPIRSIPNVFLNLSSSWLPVTKTLFFTIDCYITYLTVILPTSHHIIFISLTIYTESHQWCFNKVIIAERTSSLHRLQIDQHSTVYSFFTVLIIQINMSSLFFCLDLYIDLSVAVRVIKCGFRSHPSQHPTSGRLMVAAPSFQLTWIPMSSCGESQSLTPRRWSVPSV